MHHTMKTTEAAIINYELTQVSLSCFDDKRYIRENGTISYAYGCYKIKKLILKTHDVMTQLWRFCG